MKIGIKIKINCHCERMKRAWQSGILSFRGCETAEESHEIKTKRFFGRSCRFDLNRKFNANPLNDGRSFAFTLAEVLITLTIIGVIAALTIPNLMQSYRKHERITQIKTAYSIIQNAVKMSIAENGSPDGWAFGVNGSKDIAERYILPYLKVQYICGQARSVVADLKSGCFIDNGTNGTWYYLNGSKASDGTYTSSYYYSVKLQNGMDFAVYAPTEAQHNNFDLNVFFFVFDVNGSRGSTKAGDDVFVFGMDINDGKVRTLGLDGGSGARNRINNQTNINELLTSNLPYACNASSTGVWSGFSCARVLELNHWEFPDNYPIKKF